MSQHVLQGRKESEVLWFQRRTFLQAAAAWTAMGGWSGAQAQRRGNIVDLLGDATRNGERITPDSQVQTGDLVETGPGSSLIFVVGNSSFQMRQNSRMSISRGDRLNLVSVLRLITGGVASVWGPGSRRQIVAPTLTAGIRGTGVYTEVTPDQRSYFCNCYGMVDLAAGRDRIESASEYHQAFWSEPQARDGLLLRPAPAINHTDEELETLARLVDQRTAWQISGKKGTKSSY